MEGTVESENAAIIRVAAICGSLRRASFNRGLIRYAMNLCEEDIRGLQIELVDIGSLPLINTDLEIDGGYPPAVDAFRRIILDADSILFASPEYNYSLSGGLDFTIYPVEPKLVIFLGGSPQRSPHIDVVVISIVSLTTMGTKAISLGYRPEELQEQRDR